jgi:hypothetical protein
MKEPKAPEPTFIEVPHALRPAIGSRSVALEIICERGAEALSCVVKRNVPVLDALALLLVDVASACDDRLSAADAERLMRCANDLRGMAATMGSEITSEIASAIYSLCENDARGEELSKPIIVLLAEAARQVIGYRSDADNGRLRQRIEGLLADVRSRASAAADGIK